MTAVVTALYPAAGAVRATSRGMRFLLVAITLGACGGSPAPASAPPTTVAAPHAATAPADRVVPLAGGGNALAWDAASSTLYLTDNNTDALVQWTDAGGLQPVATFPPSVAGISLGGIVRRADGSTLVASFGFGKDGTVFQLSAGNAASALTGLDPVRRRVGLAMGAGGALYTAYFVGGRGETPIGGVATLAVDGNAATETEIAGSSTRAGLQKVVGLVATPTALYVADQAQKTIFKIALPGFQVSPVATLPKVDLLIALPDGDLLTGGGAEISRITPASGAVTTLPGAGFEQVRGLAYDPAGKRLFLIDHSATPGRPDRLHIRPLAN
jgi:DNA-binding beta-propeller fold protein YncE